MLTKKRRIRPILRVFLAQAELRERWHSQALLLNGVEACGSAKVTQLWEKSEQSREERCFAEVQACQAGEVQGRE